MQGLIPSVASFTSLLCSSKVSGNPAMNPLNHSFSTQFETSLKTWRHQRREVQDCPPLILGVAIGTDVNFSHCIRCQQGGPWEDSYDTNGRNWDIPAASHERSQPRNILHPTYMSKLQLPCVKIYCKWGSRRVYFSHVALDVNGTMNKGWTSPFTFRPACHMTLEIKLFWNLAHKLQQHLYTSTEPALYAASKLHCPYVPLNPHWNFHTSIQ